ncbi:hypothetical protein A0128_17650 [Leptospira tipperaryensis]|uniref:Uncharacterized protein n=1 Tax=Leptospira tipperaryensis TaxID=2564040 RepID=A0A1D7V0Z3_9LEPT|nr:hypothetical protein [Leptospira tipperaryensis]AOP35503.1 hypothetical protein A0128_17650 [Leptospira tipperaryensis]
MISFLKRKLDVIQKIGDISTIFAITSMGILLACLFIPILSDYFKEHSEFFVPIVSLTILSGGVWFATKFGLPVMITGRAKQSVIPGIYETEIPSFLARILGFGYFILGSFGFLLGLILLLFSIFQIF